MLNFDFQNPTRIVFGQGSVARLDELVPAQARVLVLYGGGSAERHGTLAEVEAALGGRTIHRFGGIEPNPTYETLMQAVELVRRERLDFLLAVGGGSVIDGTKFVAAAVHYTGDPWQILETRGEGIGDVLPLGAVLTPAQKQELCDTIDKYRTGVFPLLVPLTLIRHYLREYPNPYLAEQVYLNPHPDTLKLRYGL